MIETVRRNDAVIRTLREPAYTWRLYEITKRRKWLGQYSPLEEVGFLKYEWNTRVGRSPEGCMAAVCSHDSDNYSHMKVILHVGLWLRVAGGLTWWLTSVALYCTGDRRTIPFRTYSNSPAVLQPGIISRVGMPGPNAGPSTPADSGWAPRVCRALGAQRLYAEMSRSRVLPSRTSPPHLQYPAA